MKRVRLGRLGRIIILAGLLLASAQARALERWFMMQDNLLVDPNVTNLVALMQRASNAGYTHMMLSDSKFSILA